MRRFLPFTVLLLGSCALLTGGAPQTTLAAKPGKLSAPPIPTVLAKRGNLILDDDGSLDRGTKKPTPIAGNIRLRAAAGDWKRSVAHPNIWRSTWKPGMGHTPVTAYQGLSVNNFVVEVTFRYGDTTEPWHTQSFRIAADQRPQITGHIVSAWANPKNDFIESGFLLQHIRKTPEKKILEDLLLDHQPINVKPNTWYTAVLEVVEDEALFRMGTHLAYAQHRQIRRPKNLVSLTMGTAWHEIQRVRIWQAEKHPEWEQRRHLVLKSRIPYTAKIHDYRQP